MEAATKGINTMSINSIIAYCINLLLGVIGFFLVASYNRTNETLAQINRDILNIRQEIVETKLQITEINARQMTDDRVREIIRLEHQSSK